MERRLLDGEGSPPGHSRRPEEEKTRSDEQLSPSYEEGNDSEDIDSDGDNPSQDDDYYEEDGKNSEMTRTRADDSTEPLVYSEPHPARRTQGHPLERPYTTPSEPHGLQEQPNRELSRSASADGRCAPYSPQDLSTGSSGNQGKTSSSSGNGGQG